MGSDLTAKKIFNLYLTALLSLTFFASCDDEDEPFEASTYIWSPAIKVEKGDGEAKIFLSDPTVFSLYAYPGPASPSHFTILKSEDMENFSEYQTVDSETTSVVIEDLTNGKPYYFFVTAHRRNFPSVQTDTLMIIPSAAFQREGYAPMPDGHFERFSVSFDGTYGLYRINDKYYQFNASDPGQPHFVDNQTYSASWAPNANKFVYVKNEIVGSAAYPASINLYDAGSLTSTTLLTIPDLSYLVSDPVFAPDGNKITYLSTEGNADDMFYELWSIDITTQEKTKVSDFKTTGFVTNNSFAWNHSGDEGFLTGAYNINETGIYKLNISSKILEPVIVSKWADKSPAVSPSGHTLAFVSYRSGEDEIWTYDLINSKFRQITGESDYNFSSTYSEIQWLDDERLLISIAEDNRYLPVTINVSQ